MSKRHTKNGEHYAQCDVFRWAEMQSATCPELRLLFAIPNGGARNLIVATRLKAEGVKAGVPDMFLPVARRGYHGLFIELKRAELRPTRGGSGGVGKQQAEWIRALDLEGYSARVAWGAHEAIEILCEYLGI